MINRLHWLVPQLRRGTHLMKRFVLTHYLFLRAMKPLASVVLLPTLLVPASRVTAQSVDSAKSPSSSLTLSTDVVSPTRFLAAHGRRAFVDGYANSSLEAWVYPFQILSGYRVSFRQRGVTTPIPASSLIIRVVYETDSVTRVYLGPDFTVRERIFVPLDQPGAILTYQVSGSRPIQIEVHAVPVLDLMWPGGLGGQSTSWNAALSAFVLSEPKDGYTAAVGSPQIVAHDDVVNSPNENGATNPVGFTLQPDSSGAARVYVALNPPHAADPGAILRQLIANRERYEAETTAHFSEVLDSSLQIETSDESVNQDIAWSEIALDQAWVCNPELGCGFIAGYGPSRGARRPQYDWFFAGDGLIAAAAALRTGDAARARQELEFILRYQDRKSGMIWHELSQSAGLIDWAGKFPYMFVHVDISFQFLTALDDYVTTTGDIAFLRTHWGAIAAAYRYCQTVIDPATGLPVIPADKEGADEQDRIADDLSLSTSWVRAASAFAHLASLTGYGELANHAAEAAHRAAVAIPQHYWDAQRQFWVSGHTAAGAETSERSSSPPEALALHLFDPAQSAMLLDQLSSSAFQTDWGARSIGAGSAGYDPASYAKGSVSALHSAELAQAFWSGHRPAAALALWESLLPWFSLDSLGHVHEVLSGSVYRPQLESVPEQTWSSAGFLEATIRGLLGLHIDAAANNVVFAPHLPAKWDSVTLRRVRLGSSSLDLALRRTSRGLDLKIDNAGPSCSFEFAPQLALGAHIVHATLNGQPIRADLVSNSQETDTRIALNAPHGTSELILDVEGGIAVLQSPSNLQLDQLPRNIHVVDLSLSGRTLTIIADVPTDSDAHLQLQTPWTLENVAGATAHSLPDGRLDLLFAPAAEKSQASPYRRGQAVLAFQP